ncbi:MAG: glycosyltransferase family 39 protein [Anaerolineae bacterium]|jgi:hypothetical protein
MRDVSRRGRVALLTLGLTVRLATAVFISRPGYMDTAYYAAGALRLAEGGGFSEPFIWNYLAAPVGIPHPGFLYWMPLPSILAAPFAALFPGSFVALQVPFILLSAVVPLVAYGLAWEAAESKLWSWSAALLAVFSGFFFPYWTLPETFAPFALFGSLTLWLAGSDMAGGKKRGWRWLLVGLLVGLAHLTRADGILLLPVVAIATLFAPASVSPQNPQRTLSGDASSVSSTTRPASRFSLGVSWRTIGHLALILAGYLFTMAPWCARNVAVAGSPLSPAGAKTAWLTNYDDLFCYDCDLSISSYLGWGWENILRSKVSALWINLQRFTAEGCLIFLLPFIAVGWFRLRRHLAFSLAAGYVLIAYLFHSLIFTFPGWRGGFFHATSAALPFLYAAGMVGLDSVVRWAARRRRSWRYQQARSVFAAAAVMGGVLLSGYVARRTIPAWRKADAVYEKADRWLTAQGDPDAGVMVVNPPAFWYHTDRSAAVIPNASVNTLLEVADSHEMQYVLLEEDHPAPLENLHAGEEHHARLRAVETWAEGRAVLYAVQPQE